MNNTKDLRIRFESNVEFNIIKELLEQQGEDTAFLEFDPNHLYVYYCDFSTSWLTERENTKGTIDYLEFQKLINFN